MFQRLFKQIDVNGDAAITSDELSAARRQAPAAGQFLPEGPALFARLDKDEDGRVVSAEMTADKLFDGRGLAALIQAQAIQQPDAVADATYRQEQVSALFERADVDRDGLLSAEEMQADRVLRSQHAADHGGPYIGPMYGVRNMSAAARPEDVHVVRLRLKPSSERLSSVMDQPAGPAPLPRQPAASAGSAPAEAVTPGAGPEVPTTPQPLSSAVMARLLARLSDEAERSARPPKVSAQA